MKWRSWRDKLAVVSVYDPIKMEALEDRIFLEINCDYDIHKEQ